MKKKIEFTVKIEAEIDDSYLSKGAFIDIPIFCMKLCTVANLNSPVLFNYVPANFLNCKTTKIKVLDKNSKKIYKEDIVNFKLNDEFY